jgi:hypothetical protein
MNDSIAAPIPAAQLLNKAPPMFRHLVLKISPLQRATEARIVGSDQGAKMIKYRLLLTGAFLLLAAGCNSEPPKKPEDSEIAKRLNAEAERMADPKRALPEFIAELRSKVKFADGLLIVRTVPFDYTVLSPNSPWAVKCGLGLEVTFGTSVAGDGTSPPDETVVRLHLGPTSDDWCESVAPAIGKEVLFILSGH